MLISKKNLSDNVHFNKGSEVYALESAEILIKTIHRDYTTHMQTNAYIRPESS